MTERIFLKALLAFALVIALPCSSRAQTLSDGMTVDGELNVTGNITAGGNKIKRSDGQDGITFDSNGARINGTITGASSFTLGSTVAGHAGVFDSTPSIFSLMANYQAMIFGSSFSYLQFYAGPRQPIYFDAEWNWRFRDKGHSNAERLLIEASNGDINNLGGAYKTSGVTRIAQDGSANLTRIDAINIALHNQDITTTTINESETIGGYVFADNNEIKVRDGKGDVTTISPHDDVREKFPQARTSFGDSQVAIPFSFHHENELIGKGQYVDMAKLVKYVDSKMRTELGAEEGRVIYTYDLPPDRRRTVEDNEIDAVLQKLKHAPLVKVDLGSDGAIPAEAMETVDEVKMETREVTAPERKLDLEAGRVITVNVLKTISTPVPTGRKVRQLRNGWVFKGGELYRQPRLTDLNLDAIAANHKHLPKWVLDRLQTAVTTSQSVSSLIDEIGKRMPVLDAGVTSPARAVSSAAEPVQN